MSYHEASPINWQTSTPRSEKLSFLEGISIPRETLEESKPLFSAHQTGGKMNSTQDTAPVATFLAHNGDAWPKKKSQTSGVGSLGEAARRIVRIPLDFIDNTILAPARYCLDLTWNVALKLPAQLLLNGKMFESDPKSLAGRAFGATMLLLAPLTIPVMLSMGFITGELLNLPNTVQDPFRMAFKGRVGNKNKYRRILHQHDDGSYRYEKYNV